MSLTALGFQGQWAWGREARGALSHGRLLGTIPFAREGAPLMEELTGSGLDGRLFTDLSGLRQEQMVIPTSRYFIRTRKSELLDTTGPWKIEVTGLVERPTTLDAAALDSARLPCGSCVTECSGNFSGAHFGMLSCAEWAGVPVMSLLHKLRPRPQATGILVSGFDRYPHLSHNSQAGASWVFTFPQMRSAGGFLATRMNGAPLLPNHGAPVRLMMPAWYGCTCIKWVNEIRLVDHSESATSQMREFAQRTHQNGIPDLAREYLPAIIDLAAMPVRVERWVVNHKNVYRVVGIQWGAHVPSHKLLIRFGPREAYTPVDSYLPSDPRRGWTMWSHLWHPAQPGEYGIQLRVGDPAIRTRRLDKGYYVRFVDIQAV